MRRAHLADLTARELHDIVQLRVDVFVVEQDCPYRELDGRDLDAEHLWIERDGTVVATLRLIDEGPQRRIGRVATHPDHRSGGLAAELIGAALASSQPPWVLDAQSHLGDWYAGLGFVADGAEFVEDGIPHIPVRRDC